MIQEVPRITKKLKILIANDDSFQLMIIAKSLETIADISHVHQAKNGLEACEMIT
jgi:PleD family two-component response regulator